MASPLPGCACLGKEALVCGVAGFPKASPELPPKWGTLVLNEEKTTSSRHDPDRGRRFVHLARWWLRAECVGHRRRLQRAAPELGTRSPTTRARSAASVLPEGPDRSAHGDRRRQRCGRRPTIVAGVRRGARRDDGVLHRADHARLRGPQRRGDDGRRPRPNHAAGFALVRTAVCVRPPAHRSPLIWPSAGHDPRSGMGGPRP